MSLFSSLGFITPWLLWTILALPFLFWVLRFMPPAPKVIRFPAFRLLKGFPKQEEESQKTPWWLLLLRFLSMAFLIFAFAGPFWKDSQKIEGVEKSRPILIVVENGWKAAANWQGLQKTLLNVLEQGEQEKVALLTTANPEEKVVFLSPLEAKKKAQSIQVQSWEEWPRETPQETLETDQIFSADKFDQRLETLFSSLNEDLDVFFFSDGHESLQEEHLRAFFHQKNWPVQFWQGKEAVWLIQQVQRKGEEVQVHLSKDRQGTHTMGKLILRAEDGRALAEQVFNWENENKKTVVFGLPALIGNRVSRLDLQAVKKEEETPHKVEQASAVYLLDDRWSRKPVGLIEAPNRSDIAPLLSAVFYLSTALDPGVTLATGALKQLLKQPQAVLIWADNSLVTPLDEQKIDAWVQKGGTLIRFASEENYRGRGSLLPFPLRQGRSFGTALAWEKTAEIAPFEEGSPFYGLQVPEDVRLFKQVLTEPSFEQEKETWARLQDGTPLITHERQGKGHLIFFHFGVGPHWSTLSQSALLPSLLERLIEQAASLESGDKTTEKKSQGDSDLSQAGQSQEASSKRDHPLRLKEKLSGLGYLSEREINTRRGSVPLKAFETQKPSPFSPAGYYENEVLGRALNLGDHFLLSDAKEAWGKASRFSGDATKGIKDLAPWIFLLVLGLVVLDLVVTSFLKGAKFFQKNQGAFVLLIVSLSFASLGLFVPQVKAEDLSEQVLQASAAQTTLAYVLTGQPREDQISKEGLEGLSAVLEQRTSVQTGHPVPVVLGETDLSLFPFLYWPVREGGLEISDAVKSALEFYLQTGGTVLLDLGGGALGSGTSSSFLRDMAQTLDLPAVVPLASDHVLRRSYYLLPRFPGQKKFWVQDTAEDTSGLSEQGSAENRASSQSGAETGSRGRVNDAVPSLLVSQYDWARIWATDVKTGRPLYAFKGSPKEREYAIRAGVNMIMMALTGNYKNDQVHSKAVLERLPTLRIFGQGAPK